MPMSTGGQLGDKGHQGMARQALAQDDLSPPIHSHGVKHAICDVDPEDAYLFLHWTRLLWRDGFIGLRNHCGSSKSIRIGGGSISLRPCMTSRKAIAWT